MQLLTGDLTDLSSLLRALEAAQPDEVYNLGAISFVAYSWENARLTSDVTGKGVLNMLEATRLYAGDDLGKVRFYQASSSEMFGKVQEVPQRETTLLWPRSPYGVAKVFGHYMTINYRESYGMHASSGILFNHESPRRGPGVRHPQGHPGGRADHARPAGHARRWATSTPSATGASPATTSRRCGACCSRTRPTTTWSPPARRTRSASCSTSRSRTSASRTGRRYVDQDPRFFRPAEVDLLIGDPTKAQEQLGWEPKVGFEELVPMMVDSDLAQQRALAGRWLTDADRAGHRGHRAGRQLPGRAAARRGRRGARPRPLRADGRRPSCVPEPAGAPARRRPRRRRPASRRWSPTSRPTRSTTSAGISSVALSWQDPVLTGAGHRAGRRPRCWRPRWRLQERPATPRPVRPGVERRDLRRRRPRSPQDETTPVAPVSPYGAAKAYAHHLAARLPRPRAARGDGASSTTTSRRGGPTTFVTRKITAGAARIAPGSAGRPGAGQPRRPARLGLGAGLRGRDGPGRSRRRPDDYVVATGVAHTVADFVAAAFAAAGSTTGSRGCPPTRRLRPSDGAVQLGDARRLRTLAGRRPRRSKASSRRWSRPTSRSSTQVPHPSSDVGRPVEPHAVTSSEADGPDPIAT